MLNQNNLRITALAKAKCDGRNLQYIRVEKDRTVVTDGRCLIMVDKPTVDGNEFPELPNKECDKFTKPYFISPAEARKIIDSIPGKSKMSILQNAIEVTNDRFIKVITTDLDTALTVTIRAKDDLQYAKYGDVFPKAEPVIEVDLNVHLFSRVCDVLKKIVGDNLRVKFAFYAPTLAVKFTAQTEEGQKITGLIMPLKVED